MYSGQSHFSKPKVDSGQAHLRWGIHEVKLEEILHAEGFE